MAEYLRILKDTKTQLNKVQTFLDAHIDLLGSISTNPPDLHRGFQASHPPNYQTGQAVNTGKVEAEVVVGDRRDVTPKLEQWQKLIL